MKLKSLDFPTGYFYFDNAAINSDKVEVIAVGYRNTDKTIKILLKMLFILGLLMNRIL